MAGWIETDSQDNAEATAARAAESGKQHIVYAVDASFSATTAQLLQLKDGSTTVWEGYVYDSRDKTFPEGVAMTKGNAVSAVLAASGAGGNIGKVNIHGTTF